MKKIVAITAVLALFTSVASAELLKNFKANGSLEVLSLTATNPNTFNKNANPKDKFSDTQSRVTVGATFDLSDDASAKVTAVKMNRRYGTAAESSINTALDSFVFQEAYLNLKGVLGLDHKIGKQYYGNENSMIIYYGPLAWNVYGLSVSAIDGWTGVYKKDNLTIGAISGKITETGTTTNMDDNDIYGLTARYKLHDYLNPSVYYYQKDNRTTLIQDNLVVMGAKADGKFMGFNYGAEFAMNDGSNHNLTPTTDMNYKGTAMKVNADYGLDISKIGNFKFMGEYVMGSGDKTTGNKDDKAFHGINANYRPGLIMGGAGFGTGLAVINKVDNMTITTLGANFTPNKWDKKLNLCATIYNAKYTEDKTWTTVKASTIGNEFDFIATWNHSENISLKAGYAMFAPDSKFAKVNLTSLTAKDDAVSVLDLYLNVKF